MKKGFTLIELIGTIVILSIIAVIVTPNILVSIREYREQVNSNNIKAIQDGAKNWTADNINDDKFPKDESTSLAVTIFDLEEGGYVKENLKDLVKGGKFNDDSHFSFVLVNCNVIEDQFGIVETNYKYDYEFYSSINNFVETKAIQYAKDNNFTSSRNISFNDLVSNNYIKSNILYTTWYSLEIGQNNLAINPISSISLNIEEYGKDEEKTYKYSATINWQ